MEKYQRGKRSVCFEEPIYLMESASVVGTREGEGPLGSFFDLVSNDDSMGCASWEEAEATLQKEALGIALGKAGWSAKDLRYLLAGDLLAQGIASSFGLLDYETPVLGLYGACSTCGEALSVGAMLVHGGFADRVACVTSSHFASAEKEFRFPLSYGSQRPKCATWTVTGSGAFLLASEDGASESVPKSGGIRVSGITSGRIVDYGIKDSFNMGAAMAPAAAELIETNLTDFGRKPSDYDAIVTGDLGDVGQQALISLLAQRGIDIAGQHMDCGKLIYDAEKQKTEAGGSGCGCSAVVLSGFLLPKIRSGQWKRILFVPTGALLSKTSFNEGKAVPGIAQGVVLERVD